MSSLDGRAAQARRRSAAAGGAVLLAADAQPGRAGRDRASSRARTRYDLPAAVTIPDKSATMVMLLDQRVPGEVIALYAPDGGVPESSSHPFRVARFTNKTGGLLERGPLAIFSEGAFVGQGMTDPLPDGGDGDRSVRHRPPRRRRGHARVSARKGRASTTSKPAADHRARRGVADEVQTEERRRSSPPR